MNFLKFGNNLKRSLNFKLWYRNELKQFSKFCVRVKIKKRILKITKTKKKSQIRAIFGKFTIMGLCDSQISHGIVFQTYDLLNILTNSFCLIKNLML